MIKIEEVLVCDCQSQMEHIVEGNIEYCVCSYCDKKEILTEDSFSLKTNITKSEKVEGDMYSSFNLGFEGQDKYDMFRHFFRNYDLPFCYTDQIKYEFTDIDLRYEYINWTHNIKNYLKEEEV